MVNSQNLTTEIKHKFYNSTKTNYFLENQFQQLSFLLPKSCSIFICTKNVNIVVQKFCISKQNISLLVIEKVYQYCIQNKIKQPKILELKLAKISLNKSSDPKTVYIYPVFKHCDRTEYLLLFCQDGLSETQQKIVELQARSIEQYLALEQTYINKSSHIDALEHLVYSIGHELRNPLAHINVLTESIRLNLSENFRLEQISSIQKIVEQINNNLTNLLQWKKLNQPQLENQDLKEVFEESIAGLKYLNDSKQIHIVYPEDTIWIAIDRFQIKQIFNNLLSNAINFSPEFGTITCDWQLFQSEILITICDCGRGLSPEDMQHLFVPFYSRRNGGTGLGLTLVKKIINDRQGSIWATNLPQGGTKFSIVLPRYLS